MSKVLQINGLPVIDAKRPLTLTVRKSDIARAAESTQEPARCAVARACYRELHVLEARIHLARCYLRTNDHNWVRYQTPNAMRAEIVAFDRGGEFMPGEFTLSPLPASAKKRRGATETKTGKKRRSPTILRNVRGGPATSS